MPMILAEINWLNISINLLLVVFVCICLLMTLLILMQRPKQEGLGAAFGGGVTDQVFGARTTNVLQRGTIYLGSLFFVLSLVLAILIGQKNKAHSLLTPSQPQPPNATAPAVPETPPQSLEDQLPSDDSATPDETPPAEVPADGTETPEETPDTPEPTPEQPQPEPTPEPQPEITPPAPEENSDEP